MDGGCSIREMTAQQAQAAGFTGPQKWLPLGIVGVAMAVLIAAIVVLAVDPWGLDDSPPSLDSFVSALEERVAVQSTGPSYLKNAVGAERGEQVDTASGRLEVLQLRAGVEPPLGADYMNNHEVYLRWPDGPPTVVSSSDAVFVITQGQLVVITANAGLAGIAREILRIPASELSAPVTPGLDWARPFAVELQKQGYLVNFVALGLPFASPESAFIQTEGGVFELARVPDGVDAATARINDLGGGVYALLIEEMEVQTFAGTQAGSVRVTGKGRLLAITHEERLFEPARKALANATT